MEFKDVKHVEWGDAVEAIETCYELGWTDGLPVAPPAVERVETFIRAGGRDAHEVLGTLPKRRREITGAMDTHWNPLHVERGLERGESAVTVFAAWGPRQVRSGHEPTLVLDCAADVASTLGSSLSTSDSVGDMSVPVRQGQVAIVIAGASEFWAGWSKLDVRAYLYRRIRRSVADLKRAGVMPGTVVPDDHEQYVQLIPAPDDILVVHAGSPDATGYRCAVILSELPKVASTAVTKAIRLP